MTSYSNSNVMSNDEFFTISRNIDTILGRQSSWLTPYMNTDERKNMRMVWDEIAETLMVISEKYPTEAAALTANSDKYCVGGITATMSRWSYFRVSGTLYFNGVMVFQTAPLPQIYEYLLTH